jgi:hypothetical protein
LIAIIYKPEYVDVILHEKMKDLSEATAKELARKSTNNLDKKPENTNGENLVLPARLPSIASINSALSGI